MATFCTAELADASGDTTIDDTNEAAGFVWLFESTGLLRSFVWLTDDGTENGGTVFSYLDGLPSFEILVSDRDERTFTNRGIQGYLLGSPNDEVPVQKEDYRLEIQVLTAGSPPTAQWRIHVGTTYLANAGVTGGHESGSKKLVACFVFGEGI